MFRFLPKIVAIFLLVIVTLLVITRLPIVKAASTNHIVISEIQIAGSASIADDFIELYNPTTSSVNLIGYRLVKRTSNSATDDPIKTFSSADVIPAHGYFLWCNSSPTNSESCDSSTSATLANNNSVALRNGSLNAGILIDSVTIGAPLHSLGEGNIPSTPSAGHSLERKALETSTPLTMGPGGDDELKGNGEDTDNNANDFVLRNVPQPQNSLSIPEPVPTVMPSDTPTPNPPTPTDNLSPTPTVTLMPSRQPTTITSPTPTVTASPTPTGVPLPTSTLTITPSVFPSATVSPAPSLVPTTRPVAFPRLKFVCTTRTRTVSIFSKHFDIRIPFCHLEQH